MLSTRVNTRCPHCGRSAVSIARKILFPSGDMTCRACGRRVALSPLGTWVTAFTLFAAILIGDVAYPTNRIARLLLLCAVVAVTSVGSGLYVPLVRR